MSDDWRDGSRSPMGCSAAMLVDAAPYSDEANEHSGNVRPRTAKPQRPRKGDAVHARTCRRCGFPGPHRDSSDCIAALRDVLSRVSDRTLARCQQAPAPAPPPRQQVPAPAPAPRRAAAPQRTPAPAPVSIPARRAVSLLTELVRATLRGDGGSGAAIFWDLISHRLAAQGSALTAAAWDGFKSEDVKPGPLHTNSAQVGYQYRGG